MLDRAQDTGVYSAELLRMITGLIPTIKIAPPWVHRAGILTRSGCVLVHDADMSIEWMLNINDPPTSPGEFTWVDDAMRWCDTKLMERGWQLLGPIREGEG